MAAVLLVLVMTVLNVVGSKAVAKVQTVVVYVVIGIRDDHREPRPRPPRLLGLPTEACRFRRQPAA
jgi:hypothetical protein